MTRKSKHNVDLVGRAARLIRERTAKGEPVWWCGTTGPSLCRVFPSDEKMVRRHMRAEKPWRDDEDFFLHVGAELGAQHRDRGRLIVLDQRTHKQRAAAVRARRERNKQLLAGWRELEADQRALEAFFRSSVTKHLARATNTRERHAQDVARGG